MPVRRGETSHEEEDRSHKDWQGSCRCTTRTKIEVSGGGTMAQVVTRTDSTRGDW